MCINSLDLWRHQINWFSLCALKSLAYHPRNFFLLSRVTMEKNIIYESRKRIDAPDRENEDSFPKARTMKVFFVVCLARIKKYTNLSLCEHTKLWERIWIKKGEKDSWSYKKSLDPWKDDPFLLSLPFWLYLHLQKYFHRNFEKNYHNFIFFKRSRLWSYRDSFSQPNHTCIDF